MNIEQIKKRVVELGFGTDENNPDFMEMVIILYGIYNNTVSRNKIRRGTGYTQREVDKIMDNMWAKGYVQEYEWI